MSENQRDVFVKNLRTVMANRGVTQSDIVTALSISSSTVSDWVNGNRYPRIDVMQRLADYLGVLVSDLTKADKPVELDGLTEEEREFMALWDQLTPANQRLFLGIGALILQEQQRSPD